MQLKKPNFWDYKKPNFLAIILIPLTLITSAINYSKALKKKNKFHKIKSICVGNIYIGGTGKTPLTLKLYEIISKLNISVVTAKKYYANQKDERLLLEQNSSFISTQKRSAAVEQAIERNIQAIIFDDGLQESSLDYDLKCVCFKIENWIGNGMLIPSGPLRDKINSLKNFDIVFLNGHLEIDNKIIQEIKSINSKIKIFKTEYVPKNLEKFDKNKKYIIFSGIGDPKSFKNILKINNFDILEEIIFPDHYEYKEQDFIRLIERAKKFNAKLITTEKDFSKISKEYLKYIEIFKIELIINDQDDLVKFLKEKFDEKN